MPIILPQHATAQRSLLRDVRPVSVRMAESLEKPNVIAMTAIIFCVMILQDIPYVSTNNDVLALLAIWYFRWIFKRPIVLPLKIPRYANLPDKHNPAPGRSGGGKSDGI